MNSTRKLTISSILLAALLVLQPAGAEELSYRVEVHNTSGSVLSAIPVTFGHPFRRGDFAEGQNLGAKIVGGDTLIDIQVNKKATHQDGSLRHAVMSMIVPSLGANQSLTIELVPVTGTPEGAAVDLPSLIDSGQTVHVDLKIGADTYRATLAEGLESHVSQWIGGPIASEWITHVPFRHVSDAQVHSDLRARFYARKYSDSNNVKVDVVVENTTTFVGVRQRFDYAAEIRINGNVVYSKNDITHFRNTRWKYTFWSQGEPLVHVRFDPATLMATKAVPNYNPILIGDLTKQADYSGYYASSYIDHGDGQLIDRYGPMGRGGNNVNSMSTTGGRGEIAPLPAWTANWVVVQTPGAKFATVRNSDLAGSWGIHFRDENTGLPVAIDPDFGGYPEWGTGPGTKNPVAVSSAPDSGTPLSHDTAHQPQFNFVPYLITGDFFHFEELEFWAAYNLSDQNPGVVSDPGTAVGDGYRNRERGYVTNRGQVRGRAWMLRTLAMTAAFAPDDYPLKAYWERILNNNIERHAQNFLPPGPDSNSFGLIWRNGYQTLWMNDYLTWAGGYVVDLGYEGFRDVAHWMSLLPVARMGKGELNSGWCWQNAAAFSHGPTDWPSTIFPTINDWWAAHLPGASGVPCGTSDMASLLGLNGPGDMTGRPNSSTSYVAQFGIALAVAVDLEVEGAKDAWDIYIGVSGERDMFPDYRGSPHFALVPRSYSPKSLARPKSPSVDID